MKKERRISKFLASSFLALALLGAPKINAQELKPINIEEVLSGEDSEFNDPKIDLIFNYDCKTKQKLQEYSKSFSYFSGGSLIRKDNTPELSLEESSKIENLILDVQNGKINSYSDFIGLSKNFSEAQKIILSASISQLMYAGSYNENSSIDKIESQEIFFNHLQNFLETYNQNPLGQCGQIAVYNERLLNDLGITSSSATGIDKTGHVFNVLKLEDGTGIIDGERIFLTKTKNIEKLLEIYQKEVNSVAFQHLFFEDNKFRYSLITEDGKNFLNFIGYDPSSNPIKNSLLGNSQSDSIVSFDVNVGDYLNSVGLNYLGIVTKAGEIRGNSSSPLEKMFVLEIGLNRKFLFSNFEFYPNVEGIINDTGVSGGFADLIVNTLNEKGLNLSSRISGNLVIQDFLSNKLFSDYSFGAGASYTIPIKSAKVIPYSNTQFKFQIEDLGMQELVPTFNEAEFGINLNVPFSDNSNILINPYYTKRLWEQEFGANAKVQTRNFGLNIGSYLTKSDYAFCPDKYGATIGISALIGKLDLKLEGKLDQTDYDGEEEINNSVSLIGKFKL